MVRQRVLAAEDAKDAEVMAALKSSTLSTGAYYSNESRNCDFLLWSYAHAGNMVFYAAI